MNQVKQPGVRVPDHGSCVDVGGERYLFTSGTDDRHYRSAVTLLRSMGFVTGAQIPEVASHVEMKAVTWMREHAAMDVHLELTGQPCIGPLSCNTFLSAHAPWWCHRPVDHLPDPAVVAYFLHDHDENTPIMPSPDAVHEMIDALAAQPFENSVMACYALHRPVNAAGVPDHELRVAVDTAGDAAGLRYTNPSGTWYSLGTLSRHEQVCYYYMGTEALYPRDSQIPIHAARTALIEFLHSDGRRPEGVRWQPAT